MKTFIFNWGHVKEMNDILLENEEPKVYVNQNKICISFTELIKYVFINKFHNVVS